ncbi:MAG: TlpA disulfide reductase family protein [Saprospiraceae bacterium]
MSNTQKTNYKIKDRTLLGILIFCICISFSSCHGQVRAGICGKIQPDHAFRNKVYLILPHHFSEIAADYLGQVIDSAEIKKGGSFEFQHIPIFPCKKLMLLMVQKKEVRFPNHLDDEIPSDANYMPFVLSKNEQLTFNADITHFQKSFSIINLSNENKSLILLRGIRMSAFNKFLNQNVIEGEEDSLLLEREKTHRNFVTELMNFADSTKSIEAALVSIRWINPTGDFERYPEFLIRQCEMWSSIDSQNNFVKELCIAADRNKLPVVIGDLVPDFSFPMENGDTSMMSDLLGDSLTIIDIWASWCAPCRKENRTVLAPLYAKYNDKGFQILGYSIDSNADAWKEGIAKDGVIWPQASHLAGDSSPFLEALRMTTIPANFILDPNGKIIAKNLFGEDLSAFVSEYFRR